jgi:hypothetical protein
MRLSPAGLLLILASGLPGAVAAEPSRPNILLLVADDMRPDAVASLGNPHIKTPHLDNLVRRGTVFTRATCAQPLCYPSRAELLTGCTGFRNGTFSELKQRSLLKTLSAACRSSWRRPLLPSAAMPWQRCHCRSRPCSRKISTSH